MSHDEADGTLKREHKATLAVQKQQDTQPKSVRLMRPSVYRCNISPLRKKDNSLIN